MINALGVVAISVVKTKTKTETDYLKIYSKVENRAGSTAEKTPCLMKSSRRSERKVVNEKVPDY